MGSGIVLKKPQWHRHHNGIYQAGQQAVERCGSRPVLLAMSIQNQSRMGEDFLGYFGRLEILAFFSGFPLLYSIIHLVGAGLGASNPFFSRLKELLPLGYALTATLFTGLVLKEWITDQSGRSIQAMFPLFFLKCWGILGLLFWIPSLFRLPVYSFLHSLVFFILLFVKDLLSGMGSESGRDIITNDTKILTGSLVLNVLTILLVLLVSLVRRQLKSARPHR